MAFRLDERLVLDTVEVASLELSYVGLTNDKRFGWLIVVPRKAGLVEVTDLDVRDQHVLWDEVSRCSQVLRGVFPDTCKMNIAALGNVVRQLHVHVVARQTTDAAWPGPIWGVGETLAYTREELESLLARLRSGFELNA